MRKAITRKRDKVAPGAGGRLRVLVEDVLRVSQGEFAEMLDTTQDRVSKWITEKSPVSPGNLRLASDLTTDDWGAYQWLRYGATMPPGLSKLTPDARTRRLSATAVEGALHRAHERLWKYGQDHPGVPAEDLRLPYFWAVGLLVEVARDLAVRSPRPNGNHPAAGSA